MSCFGGALGWLTDQLLALAADGELPTVDVVELFRPEEDPASISVHLQHLVDKNITGDLPICANFPAAPDANLDDVRETVEILHCRGVGVVSALARR